MLSVQAKTTLIAYGILMLSFLIPLKEDRNLSKKIALIVIMLIPISLAVYTVNCLVTGSKGKFGLGCNTLAWMNSLSILVTGVLILLSNMSGGNSIEEKFFNSGPVLLNAYRYFKINITTSQGGGNHPGLAFSELALYGENGQIIIGAGTTHTAAGASLSSSLINPFSGGLGGSFNNNITNTDGNTLVFDRTGGVGIGHLQIDFGSGGAKTVGMYRIWIRPGYSYQAPKNWTFEASNDGENWDILDTRIDFTDWPSNISGTLASNNNEQAIEFRMNGVEIHPGQLTIYGIKLILDNYGAVKLEEVTGVTFTDYKQDELPATLNTTPPPIITNIYKNNYAFAALDVTGKVHVWGSTTFGSILPATLNVTNPPKITNIYSTNGAFVALDVNGKVHVWGLGTHGGSLPATLDVTNPPKITNIYSTNNAFAALDVNRKVHVWGLGTHGGSLPATLNVTNPPKITNIYSALYAFAALDVNGKVHVWGDNGHGGQLPVNHTLNVTNPPKITYIYSTHNAFAALDVNGKVHVWGHGSYGGQLPDTLTNSTITKMFSANYTFTALTSDGRVVKWGHSTYDKIGENSSGEKVDVIYNVRTMSINGNTVTATHIVDGTTIEWGNDSQSNNIEIDEKYLIPDFTDDSTYWPECLSKLEDIISPLDSLEDNYSTRNDTLGREKQLVVDDLQTTYESISATGDDFLNTLYDTNENEPTCDGYIKPMKNNEQLINDINNFISSILDPFIEKRNTDINIEKLKFTELNTDIKSYITKIGDINTLIQQKISPISQYLETKSNNNDEHDNQIAILDKYLDDFSKLITNIDGKILIEQNAITAMDLNLNSDPTNTQYVGNSSDGISLKEHCFISIDGGEGVCDNKGCVIECEYKNNGICASTQELGGDPNSIIYTNVFGSAVNVAHAHPHMHNIEEIEYVAYRYYKINITKTVEDGNPLSFAQLALYDENYLIIIGAGKTHTLANATLTGSSQHGIASLGGAFDNEISIGGPNMNTNIFHTNNNLGTGHLQIDFGVGGAKKVGMYRIWTRSGLSFQAPKNWTFEASNDGLSWDILDTRSDITDWPDTTDISGQLASNNIDRAKEFIISQLN